MVRIMSNVIIAVHGGVGKEYTGNVLDRAVDEGFSILKSNGSSLDAVIKSVTILEDDPDFNAGTGSNMRLDGSIEMDAAIATSNGMYGAVAAIQHVKNPVIVARKVAEDTEHVMIVGTGATIFARKEGFMDYDVSTEKARLRYKDAIKQLNESSKHKYMKKFLDTVGAVALDTNGMYSAATSTGGISYMLKGRVGDTPIFGAGIYTNKNGALVATGIGELIIKKLLTKTIYDDINLGDDPDTVIKRHINEFTKDIAVGVLLIYNGNVHNLSNQPMSIRVRSNSF